MAKENETIADIIAEMRGARTEFPFVYLMGEPDTPEVIDFRTKEIIEPRKINMRRVTVKELADRIEAAHKREQSQSWHHREMEELVLRHEKELVYAKKSSGDAAKLREALSDACYAMFNFLKAQNGGYEEMASALDKAKAALAAPVRNCDVYNSESCRMAYHLHGDGLMTMQAFADWLFAPATEKEGGAK